MTMRPFAVALLGLIAGCGGGSAAGPAAPHRGHALVEALRKGGHILVFRQAPADNQINRQELLRSCAFQRNLTVAGREQARSVGRAIKALRIPIGEVRASPLCRTRDTARLAFGRAAADRDLISPGVIGTEAGDVRRAERLRALTRRPPRDGTNTVLVTHTGNIGAGLGEETVQEGEMLAYGAGGRVVGRVRAEEWVALAGG